MLFNSFAFAIFFPVVTVLYFLLPHRFRWLLLLVASCIFYMFFIPIYLSILLFTIIVDYIAGILIEQANDPRKRTGLLAISIFANTGILFIFKYFNFFDANIAAFANLLGWNYELHTPIALSQCENGAKRLAV